MPKIYNIHPMAFKKNKYKFWSKEIEYRVGSIYRRLLFALLSSVIGWFLEYLAEWVDSKRDCGMCCSRTFICSHVSCRRLGSSFVKRWIWAASLARHAVSICRSFFESASAPMISHSPIQVCASFSAVSIWFAISWLCSWLRSRVSCVWNSGRYLFSKFAPVEEMIAVKLFRLSRAFCDRTVRIFFSAIGRFFSCHVW